MYSKNFVNELIIKINGEDSDSNNSNSNDNN